MRRKKETEPFSYWLFEKIIRLNELWGVLDVSDSLFYRRESQEKRLIGSVRKIV